MAPKHTHKHTSAQQADRLNTLSDSDKREEQEQDRENKK